SGRRWYWHREKPPRRWGGQQRSWLLRRGEVEVGVRGGPFDQLVVGAGDQSRAGPDALDRVLHRVNLEAHFLLFPQRQRLRRLEYAVLVNGLDGQGHGSGSSGRR